MICREQSRSYGDEPLHLKDVDSACTAIRWADRGPRGRFPRGILLSFGGSTARKHLCSRRCSWSNPLAQPWCAPAQVLPRSRDAWGRSLKITHVSPPVTEVDSTAVPSALTCTSCPAAFPAASMASLCALGMVVQYTLESVLRREKASDPEALTCTWQATACWNECQADTMRQGHACSWGLRLLLEQRPSRVRRAEPQPFSRAVVPGGTGSVPVPGQPQSWTRGHRYSMVLHVGGMWGAEALALLPALAGIGKTVTPAVHPCLACPRHTSPELTPLTGFKLGDALRVLLSSIAATFRGGSPPSGWPAHCPHSSSRSGS